MQNERTLVESGEGQFALTTRKVRYTTKGRGRAEMTSIMLEELTACEVTYSSRPNLLIYAGLALVGGFVAAAAGVLVGILVGGMVAVVLFGTYYARRYQVISLSSPSATIHLKTEGMSMGASADLIDKVERAKAEAYAQRERNGPQRHHERRRAGARR